MTKTWHGVTGQFYVEVWRDDRGCYDGRVDIPEEKDRLAFLDGFVKESAEITIYFECNGSYDPGCHTQRNGDPGWPPEFDEERLFVAATIREHGEKEERKLPDEIGRKLFNLYEEKIMEVEVDYDD